MTLYPISSSISRAATMVEQVLATQWGERPPAVILDSPPGAGKTGIVERLAVQSMGVLRERCMVVTQTNEQAFDLARRLASGFPSQQFHMLTREDLAIPVDLAQASNLSIIHQSAGIPNAPCVVIANGAKWSWLDAHGPIFDVQLVDEAYQLSDFRFHLIAGLAHRHVLIGDPGQIAPVIQAELERWRCDASGPHVPCPRALMERHPQTLRLSLPVSRRLVEDTVSFVQPAFYPEMPFEALDAHRPLSFGIPGIAPMDAPLDAVADGNSLVMVELPPLMSGEVDLDLADEMVWTIGRVIARGAEIEEGGTRRSITPDMIGVACAHRAQVHAVRERLGMQLAGVFVETANRFQGLERPLMFVQHPLSGRTDATSFHLDAGRLCVMLSRHRVACWIFAREGIAHQLNRYTPVGDRTLGIDADEEFSGWRANAELIFALRQRGRVFPVTPRPNASSVAAAR